MNVSPVYYSCIGVIIDSKILPCEGVVIAHNQSANPSLCAISACCCLSAASHHVPVCWHAAHASVMRLPLDAYIRSVTLSDCPTSPTTVPISAQRAPAQQRTPMTNAYALCKRLALHTRYTQVKYVGKVTACTCPLARCAGHYHVSIPQRICQSTTLCICSTRSTAAHQWTTCACPVTHAQD